MNKETEEKLEKYFKEDLYTFENVINQHIKDFQDKWQEFYTKIDLIPVDIIHAGYSKERGGHMQFAPVREYPIIKFPNMASNPNQEKQIHIEHK